jgi:hypothetical protein
MIKGDEMFILLDEVGNVGVINKEKFLELMGDVDVYVENDDVEEVEVRMYEKNGMKILKIK